MSAQYDADLKFNYSILQGCLQVFHDEPVDLKQASCSEVLRSTYAKIANIQIERIEHSSSGSGSSERPTLQTAFDGTPGDEQKLKTRVASYVSFLKITLAKFSTEGNDSIHTKILAEHGKLLRERRNAYLERFTFVQQLLDWAYRTYPPVEQQSSSDFLRELQRLVEKLCEEDPLVIQVFIVTVVRICPYVLGVYEPDDTKREKLRRYMRLYITDEATKSDNNYYNMISAVMHFFLAILSMEKKRYEYVVVHEVCRGIVQSPDTDHANKVHVFHQKATLRGILTFLEVCNEGLIECGSFRKNGTAYLHRDTWDKISAFVRDTDQKYKFNAFADLANMCKGKPRYVT